MSLKQFLSVPLCWLLFFNAYSQKSEVGFGFGTLNYTGDLARNYNLLNSKPAGTLFYRANVSKVISLRTAITAGKIGAKDKRQNEIFAAQRNASFDLFLMELSTGLEYHFLNWREPKRILRFTPYMFLGVGLFGIAGAQQKPTQYSNVQTAIPFGLGFKYIINPKLYIAAEFGARKTFFDYLDNVSAGDQRFKNYQYGNTQDTDLYYFFGVSITKTFYDIPCPTNPYK
jgi:hypothetical protein